MYTFIIALAMSFLATCVVGCIAIAVAYWWYKK